MMRLHARIASAHPQASVKFDWLMGVAALVLSFGGVLDNWAHFHGLVDQSFFTPWHAVMFGMMAMFGIVLGGLALANVCKGYHWTRSLPPGYMLSLAGVCLFVVAGCLDLGWHLLFGIEQSTEAFVSPTHILLCAGGLLAGTGPLRAAWLTLLPQTTRGWRLLGPMLLSATGALIGLGIFTQFLSPMNDMFSAKSAFDTSNAYLVNTQSFGIAQEIIQTALLMGMILLIVRTWAVPVGAMTLLIALPSLAQLIMNDHYLLIVNVLITGFTADVVLLLLHSPLERARLYAFGALVPAVYEALMFAVIGLTVGLGWSTNMITGSILYVATAGLFVAFLLDWPLKSTSSKRLRYLDPRSLDKNDRLAG